jgi:hypothetical protein
MATWEAVVSSAQQPTSSVAYKCFVKISRDTSQDTIDSIATSSEYLFQLYLVRNATAKVEHNKWVKRHILTDVVDTGVVSMNWPDNTLGITMQANVPELLFSFTAKLNNNGSTKTVTMLASCEAVAPRDCNVRVTFNTVKRSIKPSAPTNVHWASHILSSGNIKLAWDKSDNAVGYYIHCFVNNIKKGDSIRTQDTTYTFNNIDNILNPTDVFHVRVAAVNETGDKSNFIESPQLRYGNMARIKSSSSRLYSQPYVKPLGTSKFKPVRAAWIKTTDGWVRAIDD